MPRCPPAYKRHHTARLLKQRMWYPAMGDVAGAPGSRNQKSVRVPHPSRRLRDPHARGGVSAPASAGQERRTRDRVDDGPHGGEQDRLAALVAAGVENRAAGRAGHERGYLALDHPSGPDLAGYGASERDHRTAAVTLDHRDRAA